MILALLLAAATANAPAPVLHYAEARSIAYRSCVAAEHRRRPALTVAQIGRGRCAGTRSKLFGADHAYVRYGWRAVRKDARQAEGPGSAAQGECRGRDRAVRDGASGLARRDGDERCRPLIFTA